MNTVYLKGIVQTTIVDTLSRLLNLDKNMIYLDTTLGDIGCDGLDTVEIIMSIESSLLIEIDDTFLMRGDESGDINEEVTIGKIIDYCFDKVMASILGESATICEPLQSKPKTDDHTLEQRASKTITYEDALNLIQQCTDKKFVSVDTPISELGLDIPGIIEEMVHESSLDLSDDDADLELDETEDGYSVSIDMPIFTWETNPNEIHTIGELFEALAEGWKGDFQAPVSYILNIIARNSSDCQDVWFFEYSSGNDVDINLQKLLKTIEQEYNVSIILKSAAQFGEASIEAICNAIVEYVNSRAE